MSPLHDHDERTLGSFLSEWGADEPPAGFSQAVVRAARQADGMTQARWTPRGVIVPLFLAALFVSFGAAAFNEYSTRREPTAAVLVAEPSSEPRKVTPLAFHSPEEASQAEPDRAPSKPRIEPRISRLPPPLVEVAAVQEPVEERPRVVHFPHCECGTSGVVCACSD